MPLINNVNLMSYDLVSGFSKFTGHHTGLYSTNEQKRSGDYGVNYLKMWINYSLSINNLD